MLVDVAYVIDFDAEDVSSRNASKLNARGLKKHSGQVRYSWQERLLRATDGLRATRRVWLRRSGLLRRQFELDDVR